MSHDIGSVVVHARKQFGIDNVFLDPDLARDSGKVNMMKMILRLYSRDMLYCSSHVLPAVCDKALVELQDRQWRSVLLTKLTSEIVDDAFSCAIVGSQLGKLYSDKSSWRLRLKLDQGLDNAFRKTLTKYNRLLPMAVSLQLLPPGLRIVAKKVLRVLARRCGSVCAKQVAPLHSGLSLRTTCGASADDELSLTFMSHYLHFASKSDMSGKLASVEQTTAMILALVTAAGENMRTILRALILDVISCDNGDLLRHLQAEIETMIEARNNDKNDLIKVVWNGQNLPLLDACLTETLRLNVMDQLTNRRTTNVDLNIDGVLNLRKGSTLAVSAYSIHQDASTYADPAMYNPYRYSEDKKLSKMEGVPLAEERPQSCHVPRTNYVPFGYGNNVCPGRRYACALIKLIMIHLLLHYDMKPLQERPPQMFIGAFKRDRNDARIEMRRRCIREPSM